MWEWITSNNLSTLNRFTWSTSMVPEMFARKTSKIYWKQEKMAIVVLCFLHMIKTITGMWSKLLSDTLLTSLCSMKILFKSSSTTKERNNNWIQFQNWLNKWDNNTINRILQLWVTSIFPKMIYKKYMLYNIILWVWVRKTVFLTRKISIRKMSIVLMLKKPKSVYPLWLRILWPKTFKIINAHFSVLSIDATLRVSCVSLLWTWSLTLYINQFLSLGTGSITPALL